MKQLTTICVVVVFVILLNTPAQLIAGIGPSPLPSWAADAQVKLGWGFDDPQNPQGTNPAPGWDQYIGAAPPLWSYEPDRTAWNQPAQWYAKIPNLDNNNPYKLFWMSYVIERDNFYPGSYAFSSLSWEPYTSYANYQLSSELFDINGNRTDENYLGVYERYTLTVEMFPNPRFEEIWLGLLGNGASPDGDGVYEVLEVYVMTQCVPEPATLILLAAGGLLLRHKKK